MTLIQKVQHEEKKLYSENPTDNPSGNPSSEVPVTKVPNAPILLSRSDLSMVFRPVPFNSVSNQKVY